VRGHPVHEPLARAILEQGIEREFDLAYSQDIRLDYAFYVPLHFTMPAGRPFAKTSDLLDKKILSQSAYEKVKNLITVK
jgi:hypothetical protein